MRKERHYCWSKTLISRFPVSLSHHTSSVKDQRSMVQKGRPGGAGGVGGECQPSSRDYTNISCLLLMFLTHKHLKVQYKSTTVKTVTFSSVKFLMRMSLRYFSCLLLIVKWTKIQSFM